MGAVALYAVATLARGERWLQLMRHGGAEPTRADAYALTAVGYMGNNVLPARAGDAIRVFLQAPRAGTGMRKVIGTLLAERVLDVATLLTLFVALAYGVLRGVEAPEGDVLLLVVAGSAAFGSALILAAYLLRGRETVRRALDFLAPMAAATQGLRGGHGAKMLAVTLLIWSLEAATYLVAARAVELDLSAVEALYVVALASVFVLVPSGPGYVGTLDAAIVFGARAVGASGEAAFSFLLVLRFVLVVPITVAGAFLLLVRYGGWGAASPPSWEGQR
jgi:uncharacterized membrane protein YbhN (UPF0104 family)